MRVVTVLRSGGEFEASHVTALQDQVLQHNPLIEFQCLTDIRDIPGVDTLPLMYDWPGRWAKMELFRPDLAGDFLFMDLDTVVVGELDDLLDVGELTILRDFYRPQGLQSALMFLPEAARNEAWQHWRKNPERHMQIARRGDQGVLEQVWLHTAARFQDKAPGRIVSYKADLQGRADETPGPNVRVVCFHGRPRPWALPPSHPIYQSAGY